MRTVALIAFDPKGKASCLDCGPAPELEKVYRQYRRGDKTVPGDAVRLELWTSGRGRTRRFQLPSGPAAYAEKQKSIADAQAEAALAAKEAAETKTEPEPAPKPATKTAKKKTAKSKDPDPEDEEDI